jgi:hypothetical protein
MRTKSSIEVPEGMVVYGYGGTKFKPGETITDTKTSKEIIKKIDKGPEKPKTVKPKARYNRRKIEYGDQS